MLSEAPLGEGPHCSTGYSFGDGKMATQHPLDLLYPIPLTTEYITARSKEGNFNESHLARALGLLVAEMLTAGRKDEEILDKIKRYVFEG